MEATTIAALAAAGGAIVTAVGGVIVNAIKSKTEKRSADTDAVKAASDILLAVARDERKAAKTERQDATDARIALRAKENDHRKCLDEVDRLEGKVSKMSERLDALSNQANDRDAHLRRVESTTKKTNSVIRSMRRRTDGGYHVAIGEKNDGTTDDD